MQGSGINEKLINICVSAIRAKFVKQKVDVLPMNGICFIRLNQLFTSGSESTSDLFTSLLTTQHSVAVLRGGLGGPWPPRFVASPLLDPPVFCLISRSSSFDLHIQQITFSQKKFKRFEDFLAMALTIFTSLCWV